MQEKNLNTSNVTIKTRRLYLNQKIELNSAIKLKTIKNHYHYIKNVIKLKENENIRIFNNEVEFLATLQKDELNPIQILRKNSKKNKFEINIALALLKHSSMKEAIEMLSQFNINKIYPVITQRCQLSQFNPDKFAEVCISSLEQSEGFDLVKIMQPQSLKSILKSHEFDDQEIICCDDFSFHQQNILNLKSLNLQNEQESKIIQTGAKDENRIDENKIEICYQNFLNKINSSNKSKFTIFIGPEGGLTKEESEMLQDSNAIALMFDRILKAQVAAVAAVAALELALFSGSKSQ